MPWSTYAFVPTRTRSLNAFVAHVAGSNSACVLGAPIAFLLLRASDHVVEPALLRAPALGAPAARTGRAEDRGGVTDREQRARLPHRLLAEDVLRADLVGEPAVLHRGEHPVPDAAHDDPHAAVERALDEAFEERDA